MLTWEWTSVLSQEIDSVTYHNKDSAGGIYICKTRETTYAVKPEPRAYSYIQCNEIAKLLSVNVPDTIMVKSHSLSMIDTIELSNEKFEGDEDKRDVEYLVMEYIPSNDLDQVTIPEEHVTDAIVQLARMAVLDVLTWNYDRFDDILDERYKTESIICSLSARNIIVDHQFRLYAIDHQVTERQEPYASYDIVYDIFSQDRNLQEKRLTIDTSYRDLFFKHVQRTVNKVFENEEILRRIWPQMPKLTPG